MEWTTTPPTQPGWYWVYGTPLYDEHPDRFVVQIVFMGQQLSFCIPCDGLECEYLIRPEHVTHWFEPLPEPPAPCEEFCAR